MNSGSTREPLRELATLRAVTWSLTVASEDSGLFMFLSAPTGESVECPLPVEPDAGAAQSALAHVVHPLAVAVDRAANGYACSLLGTSPDGPRRVTLSLGGALELARRGVHTVLRCEPESVLVGDQE